MPRLNKGNGMTMEHLNELASGNESELRDFQTSLGDVRFTADATNLVAKINGSDFPMNQWAEQQLMVKLGMPSSFITSCRKLGELDLATEAIEKFQAHSDADVMFRTFKGDAIGMLSDRYVTFPDTKVLSIATEKIPNDFIINSYQVDPSYTSVRVLEKEKMGTRDELYMGYIINNSNVGKSLLKVNFFLYRHACTNGMIFGKKSVENYQKKHFSVDWLNVSSEFSSVISAMSEYRKTVSEKVIECESREVKPDEMEDFFEQLTSRQILRKKERDAFNEIMGHYPSNEWGKINILTEFARDLDDLERREQIEEYAGQLLLK